MMGPPTRIVQKPTPDTPISPPMPLSPVFIPPRGGLVPSHPTQTPHQERFSFTPVSPPATAATAMTPVTFLLNTAGGGGYMSGSNGLGRYPAPPPPPMPPMNPFATPFDDEHAQPGSPALPQTPKAV